MHSDREALLMNGEPRSRAYGFVMGKIWNELDESKLGCLYCYVDPAKYKLFHLLSNPAITSTICGTNSIKQMEENIGAVELAVTEDEFNVYNEVWNTLRPQRFFYGSQQLYRQGI
jgi:hypothetical protein